MTRETRQTRANRTTAVEWVLRPWNRRAVNKQNTALGTRLAIRARV